jgi:hypothetical protein
MNPQCHPLGKSAGRRNLVPSAPSPRHYRQPSGTVLTSDAAEPAVAASVLGLLGLSLNNAWSSFDPKCPIDGPCRSVVKPLAPADWRVSYIGGLGVAATSVGAIFAACIGARWIFWGVTTLLRGGRSKP